jgi:hypothetical protein
VKARAAACWLKPLPGLQRASSAADLYSPPNENTVHRPPRIPVPRLQPAVRLHVRAPIVNDLMIRVERRSRGRVPVKPHR